MAAKPASGTLECAMPRILLVKTSSLGDVIHNLPVVSDILANLPDAAIEWVCEAPYADLVALHPGVRRALPVNLRHLRENYFSPGAWREFFANKRDIGREHYDLIIDTQGLVKSAWIATFASGIRAGYEWSSAREPLASWLYQRTFSVAKGQHAVIRNRQLAAQALGYQIADAADYGLRVSAARFHWLGDLRYAVFLHSTSRADKMWPEHHWIAFGMRLAAQDFQIVLPWGTEAEKRTSEGLAAMMPNAIVAPRLALSEAAQLLGQAALVLGVDTGLAHLAVAVGTPTIGIYTATRTELTGLYGGSHAVNVGGADKGPDVDTVWKTAQRMPGGPT
jgi:heptosyltransferase-1